MKTATEAFFMHHNFVASQTLTNFVASVKVADASERKVRGRFHCRSGSIFRKRNLIIAIMQISVLQEMVRSLGRLLLPLIVSVCALGASAATATIERVWLEHGVKINGRQAMKVHCSFKVQQMKGRTGAMCIWVQDAAGRYHNVRSGKRTSQGTTYFSYAFTPGYDNASYSDFWYAPYIDDLNLKAGKHDYKIFVTLIDPSGRQLARSQTLTFSGTGSGVACTVRATTAAVEQQQCRYAARRTGLRRLRHRPGISHRHGDAHALSSLPQLPRDAVVRQLPRHRTLLHLSGTRRHRDSGLRQLHPLRGVRPDRPLSSLRRHGQVQLYQI